MLADFVEGAEYADDLLKLRAGHALSPQDVITSTHRGHGHMLARGADPGRMYAELFAREGGYNRAKGGSLHMIDTELGFSHSLVLVDSNGDCSHEIVSGGTRGPAGSPRTA